MLELIGIALFFLVLIGLHWVYKKKAVVLPNITRLPGATFFWGNTKELRANQDRFTYYISECMDQVGKTFYFSVPVFPPIVVLAPDIDVAKYLLKDNFYNYGKSPTGIERVRELFGKGIFATDGEEWRPQRKVASHMFSLRQLRDYMMSVFIKDGYRVLECLKTYAEDGKDIDMQKLFYSYTFSSFSEIAFGKDPHAINTVTPFAKSFDEVQVLMSKRGRDQLWQIKKKLLLGTREREIAKHMKVIDDYAYGEIQNRKHSSDREKNPDLISRFLSYAKKSGRSGLSDEYLRDVLINFMIAGRDTTAAMLTFLFFELDQHPDVAKKMTDEVRRVFEKANIDSEGFERLTYSIVGELHYCKAALSESLRLHPSVPFDSKYSLRADTLPDGTKIPAGVVLSYSPWLFGRSTKLWGEDALEFRPERWMSGDENGYTFKDPSQYKFLSFNAGLRLCLGKPLAYLEATIMTAMLLHAGFRLTLKPGHDMTIQRSIILRLKHGLKMNVAFSKYQDSDTPTLFSDPTSTANNIP